MAWVVHYVTYVGTPIHAGFIPLFAWLGVPVMAWFNVGSVAAWVGARIANRRGMPGLATLLLFVEVTAHAVLATWILGWGGGFQNYLIPLMPFLIFNDRLSTRTVVLASLGVASVYVCLRVITLNEVAGPVSAGVLHWVECLNIVGSIAALVVIAIFFRLGSLSAEGRMEVLAMTDALTRLPNRRQMREGLEYQRAAAMRGGGKFSVMIGDLDDFKQINDVHGHLVGDHVLRELAALLRSALRGQDKVGRWGGEEFLFVLPDTDLGGAGVLGEKLRGAVEHALLSPADQPLKVTMTFGVAAWEASNSIDDVVRRADEALYAGKTQGKNRVVLSTAVPTRAVAV